MEFSKLEELLNLSWTKKTSADSKNWTEKNKSYGQCVVSALIVQDYFGGEIVWSNAELPDGSIVSHYFNLIGEVYYDLTFKQFPKGTIVPNGISKSEEFKSTREYVLSYSPTQKRYETLKKKVESLQI